MTVRLSDRQRREAVCFHSKASLSEPGVVLGVGVTVGYHPCRDRRDRREIKHVSAQLDLLSAAAFGEGVRRGAFLPSHRTATPSLCRRTPHINAMRSP